MAASGLGSYKLSASIGETNEKPIWMGRTTKKSVGEGLVFMNLVKSKGGDQVFQKMVGRSDPRGRCSFDIYSNTCI